MLTIDDVIERFDGSIAYSTNSKEMCQYIADLLKELKERRKTPEIVRCGECRYFEDSDLSGYCNNPETYAIKTDADFGCILGERRTDGEALAEPSIQPESREGQWIVDGQGNAYCSECGLHTTEDTLKRIAVVGTDKPKFCPNCGTKMSLVPMKIHTKSDTENAADG